MEALATEKSTHDLDAIEHIDWHNRAIFNPKAKLLRLGGAFPWVTLHGKISIARFRSQVREMIVEGCFAARAMMACHRGFGQAPDEDSV